MWFCALCENICNLLLKHIGVGVIIILTWGIADHEENVDQQEAEEIFKQDLHANIKTHSEWPQWRSEKTLVIFPLLLFLIRQIRTRLRNTININGMKIGTKRGTCFQSGFHIFCKWSQILVYRTKWPKRQFWPKSATENFRCTPNFPTDMLGFVCTNMNSTPKWPRNEIASDNNGSQLKPSIEVLWWNSVLILTKFLLEHVLSRH